MWSTTRPASLQLNLNKNVTFNSDKVVNLYIKAGENKQKV